MSEIILAGEPQRTHALRLIRNLDLAKKWVVKVEKHVRKRSNPQLGLYWKWLHIVSRETGNDAEDLHEIFKRKFLPPDTIELAGERHMRWTTGKLTAQDMRDYMGRVLAFVTSELGIFLPLPEDQHQR